MRAIILSALLCCFFSMHAQLPFYQKASAADHLQAVNKEWNAEKIANIAEYDLLKEVTSFSSESERIQFHLEQVFALLSSHKASNLSDDQLTARKRQMDVLSQYAQAAKFPINTKHKVRQPYFVDDFGTACAVGYLALQSGADALVEQIKLENNYAYIQELEYPELNLWAAGNGLSMDELALIQPAYGPNPTQWSTMGDESGIVGRVNDMVSFGNELIMVGSFSEVHGHAAKNIVRWNEDEFLNFDVDIEGEIYATLVYFGGGQNLMIGGDFLLNGVRANIANYYNGEWEILQTGEMEGAVHTLIHASNTYIVAGGTFKKIDGKDFPYLAVYHDGEWTQTPENNQSISSESGAFSVSGPVYDLDNYVDFNSSYLLVSGIFDALQPQAVTSAPLDSKNLAFWDIGNGNWELTFDGDYCNVLEAGIVDGKIYFGGDVDCDEGANIFSAGLYSTYGIGAFGDGQIHDFYSIFGNTFMIGGVSNPEDLIVMSYHSGMYVLEGNLNAALFDSTVHCMAYHSGNYYVAGDFTKINGETYTNLAYSTLETANAVEEQLPSEALKIFAADGQVYCESNGLQDEINLRIYDAAGHIVANTVFGNRQRSMSFAPNVPLAGIYFYEARTAEGWQSGKLFLGR